MISFQDITIDRSKRTIARNGVTLELSPMRFRFACALLLAGPLNKPALFDLLYDDREDGGPLGGRQLISIRLSQIKTPLACLDIVICADGQYGERCGWHKRYWAEPISILSNRKDGDAKGRRKGTHAHDAPVHSGANGPLLPQNRGRPI